MGNCCGKQESDAFSQPGRVLGSASSPSSTTPLNRTQPATAAVPRKVGGPPRTLGAAATAAGGGQPASSQSQEDARRKAAEAAEARVTKTAGKGGKLQNQLSAQKKQTRENTLRDASEQAVKQREADEAAQARAWD